MTGFEASTWVASTGFRRYNRCSTSVAKKVEYFEWSEKYFYNKFPVIDLLRENTNMLE